MTGASPIAQCTLAPPLITAEELRQKLRHLQSVLAQHKCPAILLTAEGALRWLTGTKHQLGDIAPVASSPVHALIQATGNDTWKIDIIAPRYELPRLKDQLPGIFAINPVDAIVGFKTEIQGIIQPSGAPPHILAVSQYAAPAQFRRLVTAGGTIAFVPEPVVLHERNIL